MHHIQLIVHLDNMEFIELIKMRDKRKIILGSKDVFQFKKLLLVKEKDGQFRKIVGFKKLNL